MHTVPFHRRILPWIFGITFVAMAPAVIFYTSGYRYDAKRGKVERNGTVIFDSTPSGAELYIDGRTSTRLTPVTLQDVVPGSHVFRLQKNGYTEWQKTLEVYPEKVTFADHVYLWPKNTPSLLRTTEADRLFSSPDASRLLLVSASGTATSLRFSTLPTFRVANEFSLQSVIPTASFVHWSDDNRHAFVELGSQTATLLDSASPNTLYPLPLGQYRWEGRLVTGTDGKNLLSMTREGALTKTPLEKNTIDRIDELELQTVPGNSSLVLVTPEQPSRGYILPSGEWRFWSHADDIIILRDGTHWLALQAAADGLSFRATHAYGDQLRLQQDRAGSRALLVSEHELWLWDFVNDPELLYRQSEPLVDAEWHTDGLHVFIATKTDLSVMELDPRDGRRRDTLATFDAIRGFSFYADQLFILADKENIKGLWSLKTK